MTETLQELFVKSMGKAIAFGDREIIQLARFSIARGEVHLRFLSAPDKDQGVCIKAKGGGIELSNGRIAEQVHIWHEPGLPTEISHPVVCPQGELLFWNVYRVHHPSGEVTEDCWTGNAGMVLIESFPERRRYACSDWRSPFSPSAIEFELECR